MRPSHYHTRYKHDLTPRQREVLRLVALGRTNAEIAQELGLSLDGAKWHVREILGKLDVSSREEAASAWQDEQRPVARFMRVLTALVPGGGVLRVGATVGAGVLAIAAVVMVLISLRGNDGEVRQTSDDPETPVATIASSASAALANYPGIQSLVDDALRDWSSLADRVRYSEYGCITQPEGIDQPPFCPTGVAAGSPVLGFPGSFSCESEIAVPNNASMLFLGGTTNSIRLHSVFELAPDWAEWLRSPVGVLFETEGPRSVNGERLFRPVLLGVDHEGDIFGYSRPCDASVEDVFGLYAGTGVIVSPQPNPATFPSPTPVATSIQSQIQVPPLLQRIIDAGQSGLANLLPYVRYRELGCTPQGSRPDTGPQCLDGEAPGSLIPVLPYARCEGEYLRPDRVAAVLAAQAPVLNLHSVFALQTGPATYLGGAYGIVFEPPQLLGVPNTGPALLIATDGSRVTGLWAGCGDLSGRELFESLSTVPVLVPPPP